MKQGWELKTLGEVCEIARGGSPRPIKQFLTDSEDGVNWIKIGDTKLGGKYIYQTVEKIKREGIARSRFVQSGSFLLSNSMSFGRPYILKTDGCIHDGWLVLEPNYGLIDQEYLYYVLSSNYVFNQFNEKAAGSTVRNLNTKSVKLVEIPLPPLEEQRRIVAVLDEAFAGLETARTNAEANLKNAEELFAAACELAVDTVSGEPLLRIGDCVDRLTNGYVGPTRDIYKTEGVPYLLAKHVKNNKLSFDGKTFVAESFNEKNKKSKLKIDDVLLVQSGHIGHSAVVDETHEGHNCHAMIVITTKKDLVTGKYMSAIFNTPRMQSTFQSIRTGSTVPHLTCKAVKELKIRVPQDISQQKELTASIGFLTDDYDQIRAIQNTKLKSIDELSKSLLQKAFAGELT